ncbi:MAG: family 16 glycosylhydrolase [Bacteroidales bacterium]|nr:family 16 glycosylhydrolase [Bacteroidales bacterium]MCF8390010.1 family 16 glycosylhydrolase [Bacteroidales bacterium]
MKHYFILLRIGLLFLLSLSTTFLSAQNMQLVWSDEFNASTVDPAVWKFESGPSNDNVQYYTSRAVNANIVEGKLRIIALKESWLGYAYTSAHIRTEQTQCWRYGRMEASIKLPLSNGFVPAFWMLPVDNFYGWWPVSGEIDIMEFPTNEVTTIYGTVHTENYNLFDGPAPPRGSTIQVADAGSAFHTYAVEWSPERIDFFVDDTKYYSFLNDGGSSATWPFDQPFYIILNLAVGGGWVGTPDGSSVFPAIMEVDYVRVYQNVNDMQIQGADFVTYNTTNLGYSVAEIPGAVYEWSVPGDAKIISGQGSNEIKVNWGIFGGNVKLIITKDQQSYEIILPVRVSPNILKNQGFEKGVKYWHNASGYPAKAKFSLSDTEFNGGKHAIFTEVTTAQGNAWDVQLSQSGLVLNAGTRYKASLMARSGLVQNGISAAVINSSNYSLAGQKIFTPNENWGLYEFEFTPSQTIQAGFNVDMGGNTGSYYLDDFRLTTDALAALNLIRNPDFFDGGEAWEMTLNSGAVAEGEVIDGEYKVSIINSGNDPWDVHIGQKGLAVENRFEYSLSFDAYADSPRLITPLVGRNSAPWTVYSALDPISVSTTKKTYTFTFDMNNPTDLQSRVGFDIGGVIGNVYFDNILLRKGEKLTTNVDELGLSDTYFSLENFPNPVVTFSHFKFKLNVPTQVIIRIFNLNGQEIECIQNGFMQKGEHLISWEVGDLPGGVYIYRFETKESLVMGKMVVEH